jgi:hypothetical protein
MRLLINETDYAETINAAINLQGEYTKPVIFHGYWNGTLNEKHLYSILSCYYFNVYNNNSNHKIILWLENNKSNQYNTEIQKYAEIRPFSVSNEVRGTFLENVKIKYVGGSVNGLSEKANFYRMLLLYNYGGVWFDLDCFFLRSFDPIFCKFENEICLYQWENQKYPNNAVYICLEPKSEKMKSDIEFIIKRGKGWGFSRAKLTYNLPLHILVLPCSWFDGSWIKNPYNINTENFFENTGKRYNFEIFFKGSFCYHWHNKWNKKIGDTSIIKQLVNIIRGNLNTSGQSESKV